MPGGLKRKVDLTHLVNPFYLYCISFSLAILVYLWGWSDLYPKLSVGLLIFLISSFAIFIFFGYKFSKRYKLKIGSDFNPKLNDFLFVSIVFLGIINVSLVGYIPIFNREMNYREFGFPVIDPVFNTLSIFFSVFFLQSFLENKKKRYLVYFIVILTLQVFLFRRSTIVWILASSCLLMIMHIRKINLGLILVAVLCIPLLSYSFGLYGNYRSSLSKQYILEDLKASDVFKNSGISPHHYITYLYISSPLANLQKNVDRGAGFFNTRDFKEFLFYGIIPESFTMRLENKFNLFPPECNLIMPHLIVGTVFMASFYTMGWGGMIIMLGYLLGIILLSLYFTDKWNTFRTTNICILSTTVSLLIFGNLLTRLDVLLMILIYPLFFHFIYSRSSVALVPTRFDR